MNTIEILSKLESVNFTTEQARTITEIIEDRQHELATKADLQASTDSLKILIEVSLTKSEASIAKVKYALVKWIVGAVIVNGLIAALLKLST